MTDENDGNEQDIAMLDNGKSKQPARSDEDAATEDGATSESSKAVAFADAVANILHESTQEHLHSLAATGRNAYYGRNGSNLVRTPDGEEHDLKERPDLAP